MATELYRVTVTEVRVKVVRLRVEMNPDAQGFLDDAEFIVRLLSDGDRMPEAFLEGEPKDSVESVRVQTENDDVATYEITLADPSFVARLEAGLAWDSTAYV
jgi:hypothetical protein